MTNSSLPSAVGLSAIACASAALAFVFFDNWHGAAKGQPIPPLFGVWALALCVLVLSAPALWIMAFAAREPGVVALEIHGGLYLVFFGTTIMVDSPGHSSPAEALRGAFLLLLLIVLAVELAVIASALAATKRPRADCVRVAGAGVAAVLIGGWIAGALAWSSMLPSRVIAAAETAAGDRPYCIDVDGRPARDSFDLTALSMRATNTSGWTFNFHALLVIGTGSQRNYMNWSYRVGAFDHVRESSRERLHLDSAVRCVPVAHFARDW